MERSLPKFAAREVIQYSFTSLIIIIIIIIIIIREPTNQPNLHFYQTHRSLSSLITHHSSTNPQASPITPPHLSHPHHAVQQPHSQHLRYKVNTNPKSQKKITLAAAAVAASASRFQMTCSMHPTEKRQKILPLTP